MADHRKQKSTPPNYGGPSEPSPHFRPHLDKIDYPARKATLLEAAHRPDAPDDLSRVLQRIDDREYQNPDEVWDALQEAHERDD